MSDCIFCRIVDGEIPSRPVYADEACVAFLDVAPLKVGHTLIVPRAHVADALADPGVLASLTPAIATVGRLLMDRLDASGLNVISNVGADAGQSVFHLHVHLVPRYADDPGLGALTAGTPASDLGEVHARLTQG